MRGRNLSNADLGGVNLRNTNLSGVDLSSAKLGGANLEKANLTNANLSNADLGGWDERKTLIGQPYTKSSVRAQQCCAPTNDELGAFLLRLLTRFKGNQTDQPQQESLGCPFLSKEK